MFDWGGTLSDQSILFDGACKNVVFPFWKKIGFKGSIKEFKKLDDKTNDEMWKMWRKNKKFKRYDWSLIFAKNAGLKISEKEAKKEFKVFFDYYIKHSKLYPETKQILKFLKGRGLKLALISNNWKEAYKLFKRYGINDYFDVIIISEKLDSLKSGLKPFNFVLKKLNLKPEDCLMIGDDLIEDGACRKVGIKFCLIDMKKKI